MTQKKSPAELARTKHRAAAKRSLSLIAKEIPVHQETLAGGGIPVSTFAASVSKYHEELAALAALDEAMLAPEGDPAADMQAQVSREDLQGLIGVLQGFGISAAPGTPLARLAAAAEDPPWAPEPAAGEEP